MDNLSRVERNVAPRRDFCSNVISDSGACEIAMRLISRSFGSPRISTVSIAKD
jgi:hypothetical protein